METENGIPKVGRPTKMTSDTILQLKLAFCYGCSDAEAALFAGISATTLYNYCSENPDFAEEKEQLKNTPFLVARQTLYNGIKRDPKLALDYMKAKRKAEFGNRVEVTGADGVPLENGFDQLKEIAELLKNANSGNGPAEPENPNPTGSPGNSQEPS